MRAGNERGSTSRHAMILRIGAAVAALVFIKVAAHWFGLEPITTIPVLTTLMGGTVFTLAILLSGVLADFKESEQMVGELASTLRRLHVDLPLLAADEQQQQRMGSALHDTVAALIRNFRREDDWSAKDLDVPMRRLDAEIATAVGIRGPNLAMRSVQTSMTTIQRIADRLEFIIETTFLRTGYFFAGITVSIAMLGLILTDLGSFQPGLYVFGFAAFLTTGLFFLIQDLDNPFGGTARISIDHLQRVYAMTQPQATG